MLQVKLYKLQDDGTQQIIATCKLVDGIVVCTGNETIVEKLTTDGIFDYTVEPRKILFPKDGKIFLEQMKHNFKSGYLNASEVIEE